MEEHNQQNENDISLEDVNEMGIVQEFWCFLCENKKFWLIPILIILLFLGILIVLGGTSVSPFIYTLF